jgi:hypothetical protein
MIGFELLKDAGVLVVKPQSALSAADFHKISQTIDPYIREKGKLTGLLIEAPSFPGWDSFGALIEHLKLVYDHHRNINRVAAVTDSAFLKIAPTIAQHFVIPRSGSSRAERGRRRLNGCKPAYSAAQAGSRA